MIPLRKIEVCLQYAVGLVALAMVCTQGLHTIHLLHKGDNLWPLLAQKFIRNRPVAAPPKRIAFLLGADIPALQSQKKGILDMLNAHDIVVEEKICYHNQNPLLLHNQVESVIENDVDLVITVGSMAAQKAHIQLKKAGGKIPLLFSCAMLAQKDGISKGEKFTGYNSTGTSDKIILEHAQSYVDAVKVVRPDARNATIIYDPTCMPMIEQSAQKLGKALCKKGIKASYIKVYNCNEVYEKARAKVTPETDLVITLRDYTTTAALQSLRKICYETKTTLFASDSHSTKCGAAASFSINEYELGLIAGSMAVQILKDGTPAGQIPIAYFDVDKLVQIQINPFELRKQGITQPLNHLLAATKASIVIPD